MGWWRLQLTALLTVRQMLSQPSGVDLLLDNGVGTFNSTKGQGKRRLQVVLEWTGGKNSAIWWWHGSDLQKLLWALIFRVCKSPGAPEGQAGYAAEMCCAAEQTSLPHWTARPFSPPFLWEHCDKAPLCIPTVQSGSATARGTTKINDKCPKQAYTPPSCVLSLFLSFPSWLLPKLCCLHL